LIDVPNIRSSHEVPTPRGGGIGIVAGVAAGVLGLAAFGIGPTQELLVLGLGAICIAIVGAVDDWRSLSAGYRLLLQALIAVFVVIALGPVNRLPLPSPLDISIGWLSIPFTVLWLVTVTNFYNFMDGVDGLAASQAVASCIGVALAAWSFGSVQLSIVIAAAAVGFLILNRPPAKIFLGDTGSTLLGFTVAALPLLAPAGGRPAALLAVAVGLSLFLLDPLETLVRLARSGHKIGQAHRSHSYQLLASTRGRRRTVAVVLGATGLPLAVAGALAYRLPWAAWPAVLLGIGAFVVERHLAGRSIGKRAADQEFET
jgi:Fuc2NAc and GlcNAc transferase